MMSCNLVDAYWLLRGCAALIIGVGETARFSETLYMSWRMHRVTSQTEYISAETQTAWSSKVVPICCLKMLELNPQFMLCNIRREGRPQLYHGRSLEVSFICYALQLTDDVCTLSICPDTFSVQITLPRHWMAVPIVEGSNLHMLPHVLLNR
jgi:hypothetical protein